MESVEKLILEKYDRAKLLEVYFSRMQRQKTADDSSALTELDVIDLAVIKSFLLNENLRDRNVFRVIN